MIEFVSKVLTSYKADTSDHVAALKRLKGEERERAQATIEANEKVKGSLEDQIKTIGKVSAAIAGVAGAFLAARSALNAYSEYTRLATAAGNVSISALSDATKGLKTETDLLADAAKLNNGAIKLTTEQMAIAEQAMIQYTRRGHDNAKAHDAVLQAVTALKLDGLKDLGVFIDTTGLSMDKEADRGKILQRVFGELTKASSQFATQNLSDAEKIEASANKITNAIDRLKVNAGRGVSAGIGFVESVANAYMRQATGGSLEAIDNMDPRLRPSAIYQDVAFRARVAGLNADEIARKRVVDGIVNAVSGARSAITDPLTGAMSGTGKSSSTAARAAITAAQALAQFANAATEADGTSLYGGALGAAGGLGSGAGMSSVFGVDIGRASGDAILNSRWSKELGDYRTQRKTFMEQTFGPLDQFSAYKNAWEGFTGAVTAGYSAMVDGTMSFGAAFKRAVADALKATGAQMLIESLKEAAYGTAMLFTPGGQAAAVGHFKASAMFAAGAVAAGVAAHELGGGGGGSSGRATGGGAGGGAPGYSGGSGSANDNKETIVYVVGDPFDTETDPRRRQANAERLLRGVSRKRGGGQY